MVKMSEEKLSGYKEKFGIRVPLGQNVIMASFTLSHDNPKGEDPIIDLTEKKCAVWLTSSEEEINGQKYNFIIGPDGLSSPVAISWGEIYPEIHIRKGDEMIKLETKNFSPTYLNHQIGHMATLIYKQYPGLRENYTVIRLPPESLGKELKYAQRYFSIGPISTLISGMNNRGFGNRLSTSFWALRLTQVGHPDLPFGRELR